MIKESLILVGGGGHCKSVIDVIEAEGKYTIAGIIDIKEKLNTEISGYKVIGTDEDLKSLSEQFKNFIITVGQIKSNTIRLKIYNTLKNLDVSFPVIISPTAYVSRRSIISEGTVIMHKAFVNAGAKIGVNTIINTASIIEHDASIGNHCHISTGAILNGDCSISDNSFIGSNAVIANGVAITQTVLIGAGAVVVKNITEGGIYIGNPAKIK